MGGTQGVNHVDSVGEQDAIAVLARGIAECGGQVGFAEANLAPGK